MSEMSETDYLKPFIKATNSAASRFRRVLIVLIVASVLAFGAFWNSLPSGWLNSRIEKARYAEKYLTAKETEKKLSDLQISDEERKRLTAEKLKLDEQLVNINKDDAVKWLEQRHIERTEQISPIVTRMELARLENVILIRIPFFGVVIDINDLGMIGGFTFLVIMMWFRFSLWREYYNLHLTFKEAKEEHFEYCYKTLAMEQVITVPPNLSEQQPSEKPWGKAVRILYFLPVLIQFTILINDALSFETGWIVSGRNAIIGISASLFFLGFIALLTYWCWRLSSEIDKEWVKAAKRIRNNID